MTTRDEDSELRVFGFRFCPWLERWRLAASVTHVPHSVAYAQLPRCGRDAKLPLTTVTMPDDTVLEDKVAIYHTLARAATTCEGWMARLSDEDVTLHVDTSNDLGNAMHTLLMSGVRSAFDQALLQVQAMLALVERNPDLQRFVLRYRHASEGTHFLDAFYAPILLRLHLLNSYLGTKVVDFEAHYPTLHIWLHKCLNWSLLQSTLGDDFGPELLAFYKDRGSYILNTPLCEAPHVVWNAKYVPAVWVRKLRLDVCESWIQPAQQGSLLRDMVFAAQRVCSCLAAERSNLLKYSNIDMKLQQLEKFCKSLEEEEAAGGGMGDGSGNSSRAWPKFVDAFRTLSYAAFGERVQKHLLENVSLQQLWLMESDILSDLRSSGVMSSVVSQVVEHQPIDTVLKFVDSLIELILIEQDAGVTSVATDVLQMVYRDSNPSDWIEISEQCPLVQGLVLATDNWHMHYKYPAISLLSSFYSFVKSHVLAIHSILFQEDKSSSSSSLSSSSSSSSLVSSAQDASVPASILKDLDDLRFLTRLLSKVVFGEYATFFSRSETNAWTETHRNFEALFTSLGENVSKPKKFRVLWKKLKKEIVLYLRSQKKLVVPHLLRFEEGERLVEAQLKCFKLCDDQTLRILMEEVSLHSSKDECYGVWNVLRFYDKELYEKCLSLFLQGGGGGGAGSSNGNSNNGGGSGSSNGESLDRAKHLEDVGLAPLHEHPWSLHPKFAGVPFILGLANRVLLDDLTTVVGAARRSLKGLGELPTTDIRNTFEIFFAHYVSHRKMVLEPTAAALSNDALDAADADACNLESRIAELEKHINQAEDPEVAGAARRTCLQSALQAAEALLDYAKKAFEAFTAKYVPRCINGYTYDRSISLFADIVQLYHTCNPHLLSRTIASLRDSEYDLFCRNILSLPFPLLKEVLDGLHAEIPTRMWLRLVDTMPCISAIALDARYWPRQPNYGGIPLFWQLSHRWLEQQIATVLVLSNDKNGTMTSTQRMLDTSQRLMVFLEKHGQFEDNYVLPRVGSALPTVAEACFEDTANEHALLESNELRVIAILKATVRCVQVQPDVVPTRQLSRMKRQVRSYQTLILPHLDKVS